MNTYSVEPFTPEPQPRYRTTPDIRARVARALFEERNGKRLDPACVDCRCKGKRSNIVGRQVTCPTCAGAGRLAWMTTFQVSYACALSIFRVDLALYDLLLDQHAQLRSNNGVDLWRRRDASE